MTFDFKGRRVLVAGGSRGIGRSIAQGFAAAGADVSICARGMAGVVTARDELARQGGRVHAAACDLGQTAADVVVMSFSDADLGALAGAWQGMAPAPGLQRPALRLASLGRLRHPMSVDLWVDRVGAHARVILVRLLGGYDWWAYGCDRLAALARERGIALALLPGECREHDARLAALQVVSAETGATPAQVVIASLRQRPQQIIPIVGGSTLEQIRENVAAADLRLTSDQVNRLDRAGNEMPSED